MPRGVTRIADLAWFFVEAEGELGVRAQSYEPTVPATGVSFGTTPTQSRAAARYARVLARLRAVGDAHAQVLLRWYAVGHYPPAVRDRLKAHAGVALLTPMAYAYQGSAPDFLRSVCESASTHCPDGSKSGKCKAAGHPCRSRRAAAKAAVAKILSQAQRLVEAAHEAYESLPADAGGRRRHSGREQADISRVFK